MYSCANYDGWVEYNRQTGTTCSGTTLFDNQGWNLCSTTLVDKTYYDYFNSKSACETSFVNAANALSCTYTGVDSDSGGTAAAVIIVLLLIIAIPIALYFVNKKKPFLPVSITQPVDNLVAKITGKPVEGDSSSATTEGFAQDSTEASYQLQGDNNADEITTL